MRLPWQPKERREAERCRVDIPCRLTIGQLILTGKTRDLNLKGMMFGTQIPSKFQGKLKGRPARLGLLLPNQEIDVDCQVQWEKEEHLGLRFKSFGGKEAKTILVDFLESQLSELE